MESMQVYRSFDYEDDYEDDKKVTYLGKSSYQF